MYIIQSYLTWIFSDLLLELSCGKTLLILYLIWNHLIFIKVFIASHESYSCIVLCGVMFFYIKWDKGSNSNGIYDWTFLLLDLINMVKIC